MLKKGLFIILLFYPILLSAEEFKIYKPMQTQLTQKEIVKILPYDKYYLKSPLIPLKKHENTILKNLGIDLKEKNKYNCTCCIKNGSLFLKVDMTDALEEAKKRN